MIVGVVRHEPFRLHPERSQATPSVRGAIQQPTEEGLQSIAKALGTSVAAVYALAEGKRLAGDDDHSLVRPEDMAHEAMQMRNYFRLLNPEYQRLALELVKTLVKAQGKAT
ncbi:hypothetical protein [Hydrogenophaga atypica]|uniref:HTH cro/C1-type domain-containing protein n=1 Tax=Hydrogenophaga atypica TaxID=249409 RepID=A0ABW2QQV7_9BURK